MLKYHSEAELAYAAGLIDGEGSLIVEKGCPRVSVGMTDPRPIFWLLERFGGHLDVIRRPDRSTTKTAYLWRLCKAAEVGAFLLKVRPFMIVKKDQAALLMMLSSIKNGHGHFKSDDAREVERMIRERVSDLNHRTILPPEPVHVASNS